MNVKQSETMKKLADFAVQHRICLNQSQLTAWANLKFEPKAHENHYGETDFGVRDATDFLYPPQSPMSDVYQSLRGTFHINSHEGWGLIEETFAKGTTKEMLEDAGIKVRDSHPRAIAKFLSFGLIK